MAKAKTGSLILVGRIWYIVVTQMDGKRKWTSLRTTKKTEAIARARMFTGVLTGATSQEDWLQQVVSLGEWAKKRLDSRSFESIPLNDLWLNWSAGRELRAIYPIYEGYLRRLTAWCAERDITITGDINAKVAKDYLSDLISTGKKTPGREIVFFKKVWLDLGLGATWDELKADKTGGERYRRLSLTEVRNVIKYVLPIRRDVAQLLILGYYTGARLKTLRSLRVEDLEDNFLRVLHTKTARSKPVRCVIPLTKEALFTVRELAAHRTEGNLFVDLANDEKPDIMRTMFKDAGVLDNALGRASFHSLRATFISMMDDASISPHVTDAITGHAPQGMHGRYTQPSRSALYDAVKKALPPLNLDFK